MESSLQLHQNESYWLLDDELIEMIHRAIARPTYSQYPDYTLLRAALSEYAGTPEESLCITPGSDAAISILTELCVKRGMRVVLPVPTFYGYERILARHRAEIVPTYYTEKDGEFEFPLQETLDALAEDTALYLCNPNNPLGCTIPEADLNTLLAEAKKLNAIVILDEAYLEFGGSTRADLIQSQPLVILRTLSKAMGLSGARVGYAISSPDIVRSMNKLQLPWPISHPSSTAALVLLGAADKVRERRAIVLKQRQRFASDLKKIEGIEVFSSETNFILVRVNEAGTVANKLAERGVLVAQTDFMSQFPVAKELLASTLRIAVPAPEDHEYVLESLERATLQKD